MKFSEFEIGHDYEGNLLVSDIVERTAKNGKGFISLTLLDGESEISAIDFNTASKAEFGFNKGDVIYVRINVSEYNGAPNYKVVNYTAPHEPYNKSDFIITAPVDPEEMYNYIFNVLSGIKNRELSTVAVAMYKDFKDKLLYWSAAKSHHHNCYSGLLYHTYRMVKSAIELSKIYNVNPDLVVTGCALHDIGKLKELRTDELGIAEYTVDGQLFGHLFIGAELIKYYCQKCKVSKDVERELTHIIVSHHQNLEWGAIARPASTEAFLVSFIDYIDSQIYVYEKAAENMDPGTVDENYILGGIKPYKSALEV